MFSFNVNGKKVKAEVSTYTAYVYESEFNTDVIQDLFGSMREDEAEFTFDGDRIVGIDFTKVSWSAVTRAFWAAVKTATPSTSGYAEWSKSVKGLNMWELREVLMGEYSDCFFRTTAPEADGEEEE